MIGSLPAGHFIAIIDPIFSLVLVIALILGFKYRKTVPARVGLGANRIYPGASARKFNLERDLPKLERESVLSHDIDRFSKLANGYVVVDSNHSNVLTDIRFRCIVPFTFQRDQGIKLPGCQAGHWGRRLLFSTILARPCYSPATAGNPMAARQKYLKREQAAVAAIQLNLETDGFTYRKWGGEQTCKPGDWIVDNGGDVAQW